MTTTSSPLDQSVGSAVAEEANAGRCGVCHHDLAEHDAIGLRYCRATQEQALTRGCICAKVTAASFGRR